MECLPTEINTKILIGLPVKTLGQLKCVSKSFNMLLKSHHFIKRHSHQILDENSLKLVLVAASSSVHTLTITDQNLVSRVAAVPLPPDDVSKFRHPTSLVGTCMGLACLRCPPNTYSLLNPTTKEFRVLPSPGRFWTTSWPPSKVSGFGYIPSLDDFRVVCVALYKDRPYVPVIKVFSGKSDSWKTKPITVREPLFGFFSDYAVYFNGSAYWLGWSADNIDAKYQRVCLTAFDFVKEEFSTVSLHDQNIHADKIKAFVLLEGCLTVVVDEDDFTVGMWMMKEAGDAVLFNVNLELRWYDPVKDIASKLGDLRRIRSREGRIHIAKYEESLISSQDIRQCRIASIIADEEITGLKIELNKMILKLQEAEAHEKDLLEKLRIAEEAHAEEYIVMKKRIKELEDEVSRLRLGNQEARGSGNKDAAAEEVA
nr:PREDICTED: F-box protein CPR30-like [Daucus carota subsp. sativus]